MADHRPSTSLRDNYLQLKTDRKNNHFISSAGVFLQMLVGDESADRGDATGPSRSTHRQASDPLTFSLNNNDNVLVITGLDVENRQCTITSWPCHEALK